jgi:hypothetical protein
MVQRGAKPEDVVDFVRQFVRMMEHGELIIEDRYAIVGRLRPRRPVTLRLNVMEMTKTIVGARVITVHEGQGGGVDDTVVDLM